MRRAKKEEKSSVERRYQRATCNFPAQFTWGTITNNATVRTVGIGGCFVSSEVLVPQGEEMALVFRIEPFAEPVECFCEVAWVSERGIRIKDGRKHRGFALEFKKIFPEQMAKIDEYVKKKIRVFRTIDHELKKARPDKAMIKNLFASVYPGESTHLNHIKAVCRKELKNFRLRK